MLRLYTILIIITGVVLRIIALFNKKIRLFVLGRKTVFETLSGAIGKTDKVIWMHAASLGEFEQGLPVIKKLKKEKPDHKILVTFFSPSGYEVKKHSPEADCIVYLPLDTRKNARKFLELAHPELALFIKYEFWPNYLNALQKRNTPVFLVSGVFRKEHIFFKSYGGFMRKQLNCFTHFFVQEEHSQKLLHTIGLSNVTLSGDTRFDRVSETLQSDNTLPFIEAFLGDKPCVVIGSSWPEDEALFVPFINQHKGDTKFIIAPHLVKTASVAALKKKITRKSLLFSEKEGKSLPDYDVLIINTIGLLTKIYRYATCAYVGGGMGTRGLHNILEAVVFGIPVIIGKNYTKFNEAVTLIALGGVVSVKDEEELTLAFHRFIWDNDSRMQAGAVNAAYIREQRGSTEKIAAHILSLL